MMVPEIIKICPTIILPHLPQPGILATLTQTIPIA